MPDCQQAPTVSVIIPVHNRFSALRETLTTLARQSYPPAEFEVIVVDDGSEEQMSDSLSAPDFPLATTLLRQPQRGAASARNHGAGHARGRLLLFLDADMMAVPHWIAEHVRSHTEHPHALVAGRRAPWEAARTSRFSQIIDLDSNRRAGRPFTFQEAFSANLSIRAGDFATLGGFDETFPAAGAEDIDLAYRAQQHGCSLVYNPAALGYHNHPIDLARACRQAYAYQSSMALLLHKHPELGGRIAHLRDKEPIAWKRDDPTLIVRKVARRFLAARPILPMLIALTVLAERICPYDKALAWLYWKVLGGYQLRGLHAGLQRYGQ